MSNRGLSDALVAAADSANVRLLLFVKLELDSGTLYLHDGVGSYTWGGFTWLGLGDFGGVSTVEESDQLSPFEITLTLSGLDASMMDEVMNQNYYLRPVTLYIGAIDLNTGAFVSDPSSADPDEIWSGEMDSASVTLGEQNAIVINCESEFSVFDKSNDKAFSDADLQAEYAGDLFFEFLPSMVDALVIWRGNQVTTGAKPLDPYFQGDNRGRERR